MPRYTISKRYRFEAAHRLGHLPSAHPCAAQHGHGYQAEVVLAWSGEPPTPPGGWVVDFGEIDTSFGAWVKETLDHKDLNEVFKQLAPGLPTTAECLAYVLWQAIQQHAPSLVRYVEAVRISETERTWAEFRP